MFGGGVWTNSIDADDGRSIFTFDTDLGWLVGASLGAHITDNLRGEIELSTSQFDLSGLTVAGIPATLTDGNASATYLLGNLWYDIDTGSGFTPYIGAGIGAGYVTADGAITVSGAPGTTPAIDIAGWGWAYQIGAGVKFDVADNVALDLGYRWKSVVDAKLEGPVNDATATVGSHVLQVGLTIGF